MNIELKILEITNNLNIAIKDKRDINEYLEHNELGLAFEVLCVSIERDKIKISQKDYEIINTLGIQMEMDNNLWINLKNNVIK
ncbi:MAG: MafI family immunity protein [Bacilli bacterium]